MARASSRGPPSDPTSLVEHDRRADALRCYRDGRPDSTWRERGPLGSLPPPCKRKRPGEPGRLMAHAMARLRALRVELDVVAFVIPFVDDIVDLLEVALGVDFELAQHRIPCAGLDRAHDLLRIHAAGLLDRLRPDLDRGVGIERIAFGID